MALASKFEFTDLLAPRGMACGDVDGDGDLDMAVGNLLATTRPQIYRNQGGAEGGTEGQFIDVPNALGAAKESSYRMVFAEYRRRHSNPGLLLVL